LLVTFIIIIFSSQAHAGAWVQGRQNYFLKVSTSYHFTEQEYNPNGELLDIFDDRTAINNASYKDISITTYFEYGITNHLTVVANLPFKILTTDRTETILFSPLRTRDVSTTNGGFSDLTVSLRYPLLRLPLALSLQAGAKVPLGYEKEPENGGSRLGTGEMDWEAHFLVGKSLHPFPAYVTGGIGYRIRGGIYHDEITYSAEFGITPGRFLVKMTFEGLQSTADLEDVTGTVIQNPLPGGGGATPDLGIRDQDVYKIMPSLSFSFWDRFSIETGAFHILTGKNTISGTTYTIGFILNN
jgi:hypothetical protein